jgi:phosphatidylglycerophosphate synthase
MEQPASQPSEPPVADLPESSSSPGKPRRWLPSHSWTQTQLDVLVVAISAAAAAIGAVLGVAQIPWWGLLLATAVTAAIAICATHAINAKAPEMKARWWRTSFLATLALLVGGYVYHQWLDPVTQVPKTYQLVVDGDDTNVIPLFGEAGGDPQTLETGQLGQRGLIGGQTYEFDCWLTGRGGAVWLQYRRFGRTWYAPGAALHPPAGLRPPDIPHC